MRRPAFGPTEFIAGFRQSGGVRIGGPAGQMARPAMLFDCVRARSNRLLEEQLRPGCAEMAKAVLLGEREQVEYGRTEDFMATGVYPFARDRRAAHRHFGRRGLVARPPNAVVARLGRGAGLGRALGYMLLVDAGPSVVRATVLVLVMCAAWYLGRHPLSFNSLAAAALVVLALNPNHLFHAGAQLSFLSVAGIMWFAPSWKTTDARSVGTTDRGESLLAGEISLGRERSLRHLALISATIWLLTMPLVMARFHLLRPSPSC